jgi:hypothetical protein
VVEWAGIAVVGVYVSPNSGLDAYGDFLDGVSNSMRRRCRSRQVLILGDFNARSSQWGDTRTNARGRMLSDWAGGANQQGLNEHVRSIEGILCGRRHVDHCQPAPTDTQLERGRGGRDTV